LQLDDIQKSFLFPEYSIIIEIEEMFDEEKGGETTVTKEDSEGTLEKTVEKLTKEGKIWEDAVMKEEHAAKTDQEKQEEEDDAKLTQQDYNKALSDQIHDPLYIQFLTKIDRTGKNQIIRYCESSAHRMTAQERKEMNLLTNNDCLGLDSSQRDHGRLFASTEMKKKEWDIPPCPHCGGPRAFEFQVNK
jgi:hypothetical protein